MTPEIKIGTRGSQLALWQADYVQSTLQQHFPDVTFTRVIIKTTGDRDQKSSLTKIGGQGVFTKTIEEALLGGQIDIAVHSLKDLPTQENEALMIAAVPVRGPVADVLVTADGRSLFDLGPNAVIATGSIRRRAQLMALRSDLQLQDLRGNIDTRLKKLATEGLDAIIMAQAAIIRLNLTHVKYSPFTIAQMTPAVGQGAIAVQTRCEDTDVRNCVARLNHQPTYQAIMAERATLRTLDSGCQFPIGAHAWITSHTLHLIGFAGDLSGHKIIKRAIEGDPTEADALGRQMAQMMIDDGVLDLLNMLKNEL